MFIRAEALVPNVVVNAATHLPGDANLEGHLNMAIVTRVRELDSGMFRVTFDSARYEDDMFHVWPGKMIEVIGLAPHCDPDRMEMFEN